MRIQHNITALNAHRNLTNNNSSVSKNLEKLSSGYRINRAGDDAAGLAISEKMRAQITGLETAQKNAEDGVSLVQTAEGALTEVHSMLNRMVELATQSANGTYSESNRSEMQKEINALRDEVDRISDTANFNGTKLFQGGNGASAAAGVPSVKDLTLTDNAAVKSKQTIDGTAITSNLADGAILKTTVNYTDANGKSQSAILELTYNVADQKLYTKDGTGIDVATDKQPSKAEMSKALLAAAKADAGLSKTFKISDNAGTLTFEALEAGANTKLDSVVLDYAAAGANQTANLSAITQTQAGGDAFQSIDLANDYTIGDVFTVGGKKFALVNTQDEAVALGKDVNAVILAGAGNVTQNDITELANLIEQKTGYKPEVATTTLNFKAPAGTAAAGNGATIDLHVGESSDNSNKITVNIKAMSSKSLEIDGIDIGTAEGAKEAIDTVNNAIDTVSSIRSDLGALQNRLEHTINNIGVQTENITAAESRIRDVDMAKEMMAYTKNNILVQASQAMLAQANQVPQGVLQLLQ